MANIAASKSSSLMMPGVSGLAAPPVADRKRNVPQPAERKPFASILRLLQSEGKAILRLLSRLLGSEADVLDAYQDCFCKLADLGGSRKVANPKAYLYRTATNIAIEMLRSGQRRQSHLQRLSQTRREEAVGSEVESFSPGIVALRAAIPQLPAHLQNVIVLRDLAGLSYEEVSHMLRINPATARVYRRHAVVRLAELMAQEGAS